MRAERGAPAGVIAEVERHAQFERRSRCLEERHETSTHARKLHLSRIANRNRRCRTLHESLSKILAAKDAGSGPTATTNPGQHPPTAAMSAADPSTTASTTAAKSNQPQQPPTAAMTSAATNLDTSTSAAKPREQHPPTTAMDQAAHGSAAAGAPGKADASAALERARNFDKAGQEAQCMDAVQQAKKLAGS